MADEGASVVLKIDGNRPVERYSIILSGGRLFDDFFRKDGDDEVALMQEAASFYDTYKS